MTSRILKLNPRQLFRPAVIFLLILGIGIGFLLTIQTRTKPIRVLNPVAPYASLKEALDNLNTQQGQLQQEIALLNQDITSLQNQVKISQKSTTSLSEELERFQSLAGFTQLTGEGVEIILDDAPYGELTSNSIAHAADLRDLVNYLWASGAQAISINGERVIGSTSIDCVVNTILINNSKIVAPFVIRALGNASTLETKVKDKSTLKDIYDRVASEGIRFDVYTKEVTIAAYQGSILIERAKIIQ